LTFDHKPLHVNPFSQSMKRLDQHVNTGSNLSSSEILNATYNYIDSLHIAT